MPNQKRRTGSAGRYGARYGRVARRRVSDIEATMRRDHSCPRCSNESIHRAGTGIWECSKCDHRFTGGAYRPETPTGRIVGRSIRAAVDEGEEDE